MSRSLEWPSEAYFEPRDLVTRSTSAAVKGVRMACGWKGWAAGRSCGESMDMFESWTVLARMSSGVQEKTGCGCDPEWLEDEKLDEVMLRGCRRLMGCEDCRVRMVGTALDMVVHSIKVFQREEHGEGVTAEPVR